MDMKEEVKRNTCSVCYKEFKNLTAVKRHEKTHINKKPKKCRRCPELIFDSPEEYFVHLNEVHQGKMIDYFICSMCGKQFKTRSELTNHIKSKCGTIKLYKCEVCKQKLMNPGSLHNHMLRHKGEPNFMCRFCAKLFLTAGQLKVHERIHTKEKVFVCNVCGKGFCHRQSLITHSTLHTGIKPYLCENCGHSFSCVGNLLKHRKTHSECGLKPLTTHRVINPITKQRVKVNTPANSKLKEVEKQRKLQLELFCSTKVTEEEYDTYKMSEDDGNKVKLDGSVTAQKINKSNLNENSNSVVDSSEDLSNTINSNFDAVEPMMYPSINAITKSKLKQKQRIPYNKIPAQELKTPATENKLVLDYQDCDKVFPNADPLRSHKNTCHKTYTYVCKRCGKQYRQKSALLRHEQNSCGGEPVIECNVCGKRFSSIYVRKSHMTIHNAEKKLSCRFCNKSFHWKGQLKIHERSHTGEKPFACLYCPKAFAYRESLITHSSLHTGIKPHLCKACGSRFSCIGNLIKHKTTHASTCGIWYSKNTTKN